MPAHFTHLIFAEEALTAALGSTGEEVLKDFGNLFRFGAQGPDFFYHNQRTRPTGLKYGSIIHRWGYGQLVGNMALQAKRNEAAPVSAVNAFILGFATHAPLDRYTHPFINYFSGWVSSINRESQKYFRCHPFLERIIDVLMLKRRRRIEPMDFDFFSLIDCGTVLAYPILKLLLKSLHVTYPGMHFKSRDRRRIENAYKDAIFFYNITDHRNPEYRRIAWEMDQQDSSNIKRLALFHPLEIEDDIDFLNLNKAEWRHPCYKELRSTSSFPELYDKAQEETVAILQSLWQSLASGASPEKTVKKISNASLDSGRDDRGRCNRKYSSPLPLNRLIDQLYSRYN